MTFFITCLLPLREPEDFDNSLSSAYNIDTILKISISSYVSYRSNTFQDYNEFKKPTTDLFNFSHKVLIHGMYTWCFPAIFNLNITQHLCQIAYCIEITMSVIRYRKYVLEIQSCKSIEKVL